MTVPDGIVAEASGVHVLVIPYPARGHSLAACQLARKFVRDGVRVTVFNLFSEMGSEQSELCATDGIEVLRVGPADADKGTVALPYLKVVNTVVSEAEQLIDSLSPPVSCIIGDFFLGWTQDVADKFDIPRYVLCASPAKVLASFLYSPELDAQGILPVEESDVNEIVHIPGLPPLRRGDMSQAVQKMSSSFFHFFLKGLCVPVVAAAAGYFVNSFEELEPNCIDAMRTYPYPQRDLSKGPSLRSVFAVGPLVADAYLKLLQSHENGETQSYNDPNAKYLQWLDTQSANSVLYVNFGSVAALSVEQIEALASGLEASKHPYLLVVRAKEMGKDENFTPPKSEHGFVQLQWVNQVDVLSHPAVGGFLTHCGWNSTLESICRGVPLLAWPIQADQKLNCRFLVDEAHAAIEVHKGADGMVSQEEVARAVRVLMGEPEGEKVRATVGKLRDQMAEATSKNGSVNANVDAFIEELRHRNAPAQQNGNGTQQNGNGFHA